MGEFKYVTPFLLKYVYEVLCNRDKRNEDSHVLIDDAQNALPEIDNSFGITYGSRRRSNGFGLSQNVAREKASGTASLAFMADICAPHSNSQQEQLSSTNCSYTRMRIA